MKKYYSHILALLLITALVYGCKKDKGDPPVLPPFESMTIDFADFSGTAKGAGFGSVKGTNTSNWEFASTVVSGWKLLIANTLAVPVTAYKLAADQTPGFISTKSWQWSYNVSVQSVAYKARLTGVIGSTDVAWKLYVSKEGTGGFTEFIWMEGTSKLDGTGGQWVINESSASPQPILQVDWTKSGNSVATIKYTFVKNLDAKKGSYISYGTTTTALNAFFTVHYYNGTKFSDVSIEWNTTAKNGRLKSADYADGTSWFYWDANKLNIIVP
jgi:hypothetical protein